MLNLPNFLTMIRIATIPLFLLLLFSRNYTWALWVFAFGGLTDALDGLIDLRLNRKILRVKINKWNIFHDGKKGMPLFIARN